MRHTTEFFSKYLNLLYNSTYIPMHYIKNDQIIAVFPQWVFPVNDLMAYKNAVAMANVTFDYFVTDDDLYMGIVRNPKTDDCVIVGPVTIAPLSALAKNKIIQRYSDTEAMRSQISEYFERTPIFALHRFLNIMALINISLNDEVIDISEKYAEADKDLKSQISKVHSESMVERKENENYHDTYYFEQEYYEYVEKGDVEGLSQFMKVIPPLTEGSVGPDNIRQSKNIFITTIALVTRHAISGGLDIETAYQLSDTYIQEMENMSDQSAIMLLANTAVFDFTKRVLEAKIPTDMSPEIFRCIQYISNHVNQPLSVEALANELHMDRSTLSKKFKRELGFNISSFIMRRKLEEAKSLLIYSDKTISEISEYLCFSSQAYFQNVFKKKYGITPREYRLK